MEPLPFQERKFDIVTMTEVLEHFRYQPVDALRKIRGVLKDDGVFLLTTPALGPHWTAEYHAGPFETIPPYRGENEPSVDKHWKIYDAEELGRLLRTAGFDAAVTLYLNINTGNEGLYAFATKVAMTPPHSTRIP
jgi:SAM-dependent methyltransferase